MRHLKGGTLPAKSVISLAHRVLIVPDAYSSLPAALVVGRWMGHTRVPVRHVHIKCMQSIAKWLPGRRTVPSDRNRCNFEVRWCNEWLRSFFSTHRIECRLFQDLGKLWLLCGAALVLPAFRNICCVNRNRIKLSKWRNILKSSVFWVVTQSKMVWYRCFGTTHRSYLHGRRSAWPLTR